MDLSSLEERDPGDRYVGLIDLIRDYRIDHVELRVMDFVESDEIPQMRRLFRRRSHHRPRLG